MTPMLFMLAFLGKRSRVSFGYMLLGITMGLLASQLNALIVKVSTASYIYVTTNLTPICEEILKALPVLFYVFAVNRNPRSVISTAFCVGIGFALFENATLLIGQGANATLLWAFCRGIGTGLMHGICTAGVGLGMSIINYRKELFLPGTFSVLSVAVIFHSIFNTLVQTEAVKYLGIALPVAVYIPLLIFSLKWIRKNEKIQERSTDT